MFNLLGYNFMCLIYFNESNTYIYGTREVTLNSFNNNAIYWHIIMIYRNNFTIRFDSRINTLRCLLIAFQSSISITDSDDALNGYKRIIASKATKY